MTDSKYPRIVERGSKPRFSTIQREAANRANNVNYGKPCAKCGKGTTRIIWVQVDIFRGDDEPMRLCNDCWNTPTDELLALFTKEQQP